LTKKFIASVIIGVSVCSRQSSIVNGLL